MRSSRQVRPVTPRVLNTSDENRQGGSRNTTRRSTRRRSNRGQHSSARNTRNARGNSRTSSSSTRRNSPSRRKNSFGGKILKILALIVVLAGGFTALYFSNLFTITKVEVMGTENLESAYVLNLAEVPENSTFLRTDTEGITKRLLAEPWIQSVRIERVFPDQLVLHLVEQPVAAVVDIVPESANDTAQRWIIAEDSTWIAQAENISEEERVQSNLEKFVSIPKIKDVSAAVRPEAGVRETDEGINNALTLLREFSPEMKGMVASISAPNAAKTNLTLQNNVGVAFGVAEDIEAKEQAIATVLSEHEGTVTIINVRAVDRVSYRTTEQ